MRIRCVKALGEIGDEKGIAPLMKTLEAEEPEMREVSAEALAKIGEPAVSSLIQAMEDPESPVQSLAEATLRKIGAPAVESLIGLLNRADVHIEETVTGILIETGASAVPGLIEHLSDPDPVIQSRCSDILVQIGELAVFPLAQLVEIQDPDRLWRAVKALTEIGNPAAFGALMGVVFHRSPEVRYFAVQGLGKIKDPKAIPALVDSLPDRWAGHQAAAALAGFGWQPKTQVEQLYYDLALSNRSVTPEATQAREILLSDLRQGDFRKREFALHALMELFQEAIVSELIRILQTEGSQELGILFIESGFKSLEESGLDWLKDHAADAFLDALGARLFWNTP
jgi:HEAT repeat protein